MFNVSNSDFSETNFFYSANSEAYQDAFLTWVFYNYPKNCSKKLSEVEEFSMLFVKKLFELDDCRNISVNGIKEVKTQLFKSDISLVVDTDQGKHLIVIEDKTGSAIHPSNKANKEKYDTQLEKYYDKFISSDEYRDFFAESKVHLFYFKNEFINEYERKIVEDANKKCAVLFSKLYSRQIEKTTSLRDRLKESSRKKFLEYTDSIKSFEIQDKELNKSIKQGKIKPASWKIIDIYEISKLFNDFYSERTRTNLILDSYSKSIEYWKNQYDYVLNENFVIYKDEDPEYLWDHQSKIWNAVFVRLMKAVKGKTPIDRFTINTYNGRYWQISMHSEDLKTCIILDANSINKDSIKVSISLRNEKYGDIVPWQGKPEKREKNRKAIRQIVNKAKSSDKAWNINMTDPKKDSNEDINKIASYKLIINKTSFDQIIKAWNEVADVVNNLIDGKS